MKILIDVNCNLLAAALATPLPCTQNSLPPVVAVPARQLPHAGPPANLLVAVAAFHPAQLRRLLCWRTAVSLLRLFSWHIATSLQRPQLSPGPLFPWFTLSTVGCDATVVCLLLSRAVWQCHPPLPPSMFLAGAPGLPAATHGSTCRRSLHPPVGLHFFLGLPGGLWLQLQPSSPPVPGSAFRPAPPHRRWCSSLHLGNPQ